MAVQMMTFSVTRKRGMIAVSWRVGGTTDTLYLSADYEPVSLHDEIWRQCRLIAESCNRVPVMCNTREWQRILSEYSAAKYQTLTVL